jgi:hypothetical protein
MTELGQIAEDFNRTEKREHIDFVQNSELVKIFKEAPYYNRIITKPEGYAGDAEMMRIIYSNQYEGETPFGMFLHKQATLCQACQAVRNRRKLLKDQILEKEKGDILSLAAGPAAEIRDVLNKISFQDYNFIALDHDIKTIQKVMSENDSKKLNYAVANAFRLIKGDRRILKPRKNFRKYCNPKKDTKGFRQIALPFLYQTEQLKLNNYDLVYSAGLFDYILTFEESPHKGTTGLTKKLFDLVKPGGSLVIGNFSTNNPKDIRFVMDYICDWNLEYRNKKQMLNMASTIEEKEIKGKPYIIKEPLDINYFLKINKSEDLNNINPERKNKGTGLY